VEKVDRKRFRFPEEFKRHWPEVAVTGESTTIAAICCKGTFPRRKKGKAKQRIKLSAKKA